MGHETGSTFTGEKEVDTTDSVGTLQISDGDAIESVYFDADPNGKQTTAATIDEDPDPLSLGPVAEFSVGDLGSTTPAHTASVIEIPFSEDVSKAGGAAGALALGDNITVSVDGEDVTSRYVLDADGSSGGRVVLSSGTALGPRANASVRIDAVNDSIDTETIRPGVVDVAVTDATVTEGSDADVYENATVAFVANGGTEDVDQSFEVVDESDALVFAGRTGSGSQAFVFDTAARNWSGGYEIETRFDDGRADERTDLAVRALELDVAVDDRTLTTDDPVEGTVLANTGGRTVEVALADESGAVVARANETLAGNGETMIEIGGDALAAAGPGNYTVTVTDVATGTASASEAITVVDAALRTAAFRSSVVGEDAGDVVDIGVELAYADAVTVTIGSGADGFRANVTVDDRNGDGRVRLRFNTDAVVGETALPADGGDVFAAAPPRGANATANVTDAVVAADVDDRYAIEGSLAVGEYELGVRPGTDASAAAESVGTLVLDAPAPESLATWVAPAGTDFGAFEDVEAAADAARLAPSAEVAVGDIVVHRIVAPGLAGALASQSGSTAEAFFALAGTAPGDRHALNVTQADPGANAEAYQLELNHSNADVVADPANDTYVVAYRLDGPGAADDDAVGTRESTAAPGPGDALTVEFAVNESGPFDGLDDTERSVGGEYALVEGWIAIDREPVVVAAAANQSIGGRTTAAPGTVLDLRIRSANGSGAFLKTGSAVVDPEGNWRAVFDFGNRSVGENFTLTSSVGVVADDAELAVAGVIRANATNVTNATTPNGTAASGAGGGGAPGGGAPGAAVGRSGGGGRVDAIATATARPTAAPTESDGSIADSIREFGEEIVAEVTNDRGEPLADRLSGFDVVVVVSFLSLVGCFFFVRYV
ncbi:BGTF surface domain-containing protein [Halobellus sp. EA9]|uniref:BGTF surface domain-containing protein n=1 Tax=Halobellus sp. EA9 TaxID=3421647 RepID=UPI003EBD0170